MQPYPTYVLLEKKNIQNTKENEKNLTYNHK
jgi:hypothetical protein